MKELTKPEEMLLLAIWQLKDDAYGVRIRHHVSQVTKKEFTYGNLYSALNQLTKKQYVTKTEGEPTPERRGRRKIFYSLTPEGKAALKAAWELNDALWGGITKLALDG